MGIVELNEQNDKLLRLSAVLHHVFCKKVVDCKAHLPGI